MAKKHTLIDIKSGKADPAVAIAARYGNKPDALLEILHDVQAELGFVPESSLPAIANALNISRAEAYGVATFYHDFHLKPTGKHVIKLCKAEACQYRGFRWCSKLGRDGFQTGLGPGGFDGYGARR